MSTVTAGNPVTLDALFAAAGQTPPDTVTFDVEAPDGTNVLYSTGDPEVTNPSGDYWEAAIGVPTEVGEYRWRATGYAGSAPTVTETIYGTVFVIPSAVDPDATVPPGPQLGPCSTWITGEDVAACANFDYGSSAAIFDTVAWEASMALYEISGRRFTGLCEWDNVRPAANGYCGCWLVGPPSSGYPYYWYAGQTWGGTAGWAWWSENGSHIGCKPMSRVKLGGPVREIVEVLIGGEPLPEFDPDTGARNWRLDEWKWLTRMDTPPVPPSTSATPNYWPGCQNMSLDPDQPGTFAITYRWGVQPPSLGRQAAVELALQMWLACGGRECVLPAGVTRVVRQGVEIERTLLANWLDPNNGVGLVNVDLFLQAYAGGQRRGRVPAVWTPDVQQFARRLGAGSSPS